MRPVCLEMTAFGSYERKTRIDFENLKHNLYLITGDTGAGKTTIFDAIMFALYGAASGRDRDKSEMLHCDRVEKSVDTEVKLTFRHNGKEYIVERVIYYERATEKRKEAFKQKAILWEPDHEPIKNPTRVNNRCAEILGLDAEQFRKIIMLAQGEFREFLKAKDDERGEILGKLFDNSDCLYFQNLMDAARKRLGEKRNQRHEKLNALLETVLRLPDGESRELYLSGREDLLDNLKALELKDQERLKFLQEERGKIQEYFNLLNTRKGAAEAVNILFDDLSAKREEMKALESRELEIHQRRAARARAERALYQAFPAVEKYRDARKILNSTRNEIIFLQDKLERQGQAVKEAELISKNDSANQSELIELEKRIGRIDLDLPDYQELEKKRGEENAARKAAKLAKSQADARREVYDHLSRDIQPLESELKELENIDAEVMECRLRSEQAGQYLNALSGENGIRMKMTQVFDMEKNLSRAERDWKKSLMEASEAAENYHDLYQRFIAGQAGLMSDNLRKEIEKKGAARCPVCGSELCRDNMIDFAARAEETPSENAVNAAKLDADKKDQARIRREKEADRIRAEITARKKAVREKAREIKLLPDGGEWDRLVSGNYFDNQINLAKQDADAANAAWNLALKRQARRDACKKALSEKEKDRERTKEIMEDCQSRERDQTAAAENAASAARVLESRLSWPDAAAAKAEQGKLKYQRDRLQAEIQAHTDALTDARSEFDRTSGILKEKKDAVERLDGERADALRNMDRILAEAGFADPEAVRQALQPVLQFAEAESDGEWESGWTALDLKKAETWLERERNAIGEYDNLKSNAARRIQELEKQTREKVYTDMAALKHEITKAEEELRRADDACDIQKGFYENHQRVRIGAEKEKQWLLSTDEAWERLNRLAGLAVGIRGDGGILSFDRYVMGTFFREILEMANRRLDVMSGGRYELVHQTESARKNQKAGMGIEVLDMSVGQRRASGSLSGGEAFFTSLALALGLSDVVQNRAGGRQMDALFIDEGFGSLSDGVLDKALYVLNQLTEGNRLVGVISHVDRLNESIPQKIRVSNGEHGSSVSMELA